MDCPMCDIIGDRVLVKLDEVPEKTASGIYYADPEHTMEYPQEGVVAALPSKQLGDLPNPSHFLSVGDRILFDRFAGDEVELQKEEGRMKFKIIVLDSIYGKLYPSPV